MKSRDIITDAEKTSGKNLLGFIAHNAGGRMSAILPNNSVIHRVDVAADPTWMAKDQIRFTRIEGTKLIISSPLIKNITSQNTIQFFCVLERVE